MSYWILRAIPVDKPRISEFLDENIVAIGWNYGYSLLGKDLEDIKDILMEHQQENISDNAGKIYRFVNIISKGDVLLVPHPIDLKKIFVAEVTSDYYYDSAEGKEDYANKRKVEWKGEVNRYDDLSKNLQKSFSEHTIIDINKHEKELIHLCETKLGFTPKNGISDTSLPGPKKKKPDIVLPVVDVTKLKEAYAQVKADADLLETAIEYFTNVLKEDTVIIHNTFGKGVIKKTFAVSGIDSYVFEVEFENNKVKSLGAKYAVGDKIISCPSIAGFDEKMDIYSEKIKNAHAIRCRLEKCRKDLMNNDIEPQC